MEETQEDGGSRACSGSRVTWTEGAVSGVLPVTGEAVGEGAGIGAQTKQQLKKTWKPPMGFPWLVPRPVATPASAVGLSVFPVGYWAVPPLQVGQVVPFWPSLCFAAISKIQQEEATVPKFATEAERRLYKKRKWWHERGAKARKKKIARERAKEKRMAKLRSEVQEENILLPEDSKSPSFFEGRAFYWECERCTAINPSNTDPMLEAIRYCFVCSSRSERPNRRVTVAKKMKEKEQGYQEELLPLLETDDGSVGSDKGDGGSDGPFNERDEMKIEMYKLQSRERGQRSKKTAIQRTAERNKSYWRSLVMEDPVAETVEQACRWSLAVFSPRQEQATCGTYSRHCVLSKREKRKEFVSKVYLVQRNRAQIVGMRRLDISWHGAIGPAGMGKLNGDVGGRAMDRLQNSSNHPYKPKEPLRPVVLNKGPAVEEVVAFFRKFLWQQLESILEFSKVDPFRKLRTLNVGLTNVQGSRWWVYQGIAMPGTMAIMDRLPAPMLEFLAQGAQLFMDRFEEEALIGPGHGGVRFFPSCQYRHIMLRHLSNALLLPNTSMVRCPGIQLSLGNGTDIHLDDLNSMEEGYDYTIVASAILDVSSWPREKVAMLKKKDLCPSALAVMMILYSRRIVCGRANLLRLGYEETMCFQEIVRDYDEGDMMDVRHLKVFEDPATRTFVGGLFHERFDFIGAGEACMASMRKEAMTKLFYYSSSVDIVYRFLFCWMYEHGMKPTVADLFGCVLFVARECPGQWLSQRVFTSFCLGSFCGVEGGFREALQQERNLFILCSIEAYYLRWKEQPPTSPTAETKGSRWRPHCKHPRHRAAHALLYQGEADRPAVLGFIAKAWSILSQLRDRQHDGGTDAPDFKGRAKEAYSMMCGNEMDGIGHLSAMSLLHLAALSGLIPPCYASIAFVSENVGFGPGRFFEQFGGESSVGPSGKKKSVNQQFQELRSALEKANRHYISERDTENYACIRGRRNREKEFIFFFGTKMQCVFNVKYRPSAKVHELQVFSNGAWRRFDELVEPPYAMDKGHCALSRRLVSKVDGGGWPYGMEARLL